MGEAFTLLPAIDVAGGVAVRPVRGRVVAEPATADPLATALALQADGAEWIHLVDLDAAYGRGSNAPLLAAITGRLDVRVQRSGGIVDDASLAQALDSGCERAVLATTALADPGWCASVLDRHGERIAVGLDVQVDNGQLVPRGSDRPVGELVPTLDWLVEAGAVRYVVTDVEADGMLGGPNVELCRSVAVISGAPVIASGGIASVHDLEALAERGTGVEGAIVGAALAAGSFTLPEALTAVRRIDAGSTD